MRLPQGDRRNDQQCDALRPRLGRSGLRSGGNNLPGPVSVASARVGAPAFDPPVPFSGGSGMQKIPRIRCN